MHLYDKEAIIKYLDFQIEGLQQDIDSIQFKLICLTKKHTENYEDLRNLKALREEINCGSKEI